MPQYCLVKHRISTYVIDGDDADRNPDRVPVTGVVTFEALLDKGDSVVVTEGGVATTITLTPIEARITNGEIYHRGEEGVKLFAGGPDTNPERIRYRAKFSNLIAGGKKIELKPILFEAVPGGELALSMAQPVPGAPYPGYSATIEAGISLIEGARDEALGQVEGAVTVAVQARDDALAAAGRAEAVADSVYWQDDRLSVMGQLGPPLTGPPGEGGGPGDGSGDVLWSELTPVLDGKAPVSHDHTIAQVSGLQDELDGKADSVHSHSVGQVTGLQDALDGKAPATHQHAWGDITGTPATYPPESHTHPQSEVEGLEAALDGKASADHTHAEYATTAQVEARTPEIRVVSSPELATSPGVLYVVRED